MKWFPPPSVPRDSIALVYSSFTIGRFFMFSILSVFSVICGVVCFLNPVGIVCLIFSVIVCSFLVRVCVGLILTASIPHPMSTPTAFGIMVLWVASTPPIGIPNPGWPSGMIAMWWYANGSAARFSVWVFRFWSLL